MIDYLQAALDRSPGDYTIEDVKKMIRANDVRLWPNHKSAAVTEEGQGVQYLACWRRYG